MELKNRYQYTYFIQTYLVNQNKYSRYVGKLLKDERFKLRIFQKDKDLELYTYFLPKIRSFLFKTFEFNKAKLEKMGTLPFDTKVALLSEYPCVMFEYDLKKDVQGKTIDENSIFFKIQKAGIICFNTGICFLYLKTNVESENFGDVLNFNYKFRDINQEYGMLKNYENIKIQADCFDNMKEIQDFMKEITGSNVDALKLNLEERLYTFGYECIDQSAWNNDTDFNNLKNEFFKYINILPNDKGTNMDENDSIKLMSKEKFSKFGISKLGVNLFSSDVDINNYTILPNEFENQYFYTCILALYLKTYLKKLDYDFKSGKNIKNVRKEFVEFTKGLWIQEITSEDVGTLLYQNMRKTLEIETIYSQVKNKYDILYREMKVERNEKLAIFIAVILSATLIANVINWIYIFNF